MDSPNAHEDIFVQEATEVLERIEVDLLELEKDTENKEIIQDIFRVMHTLKGSGGMFGYEYVSELAHKMESAYDLLRNGQIEISPRLMELSYFTVDHIKKLIKDKDLKNKSLRKKHNTIMGEVEDFLEALGAKVLKAEEKIESKPVRWFHVHFNPSVNAMTQGPQPIFLIIDCLSVFDGLAIPDISKIPHIDELQLNKSYITWDLVMSTEMGQQAIEDMFVFIDEESEILVTPLPDDARFHTRSFREALKEAQQKGEGCSINQITELLEPIPMPKEKKNDEAAEQEEVVAKSSSTKKAASNAKKENVISSIRVDVTKLDTLVGLVSELVTIQARLSMLVDQQENTELLAVSEEIEKISRRLRENTFSISMVALSTVETRFQRLVRDIATKQNKKVVLNTEGLETELDKSLIERIIPPLLHVFRNAVDHGIESPEKRAKNGKPEQGTITLSAFYSGANVVVEVKDDGEGVDVDRVRAKAIKNGLITADQKITERELLEFLFHPGFSTTEVVTDVSGRGVGMDVVRTAMAEIRGEALIESEKCKGTTITLKLPLTLSILDGLLVEINQDKYIIPLQYVDKCYEMPSKNHKEIDDVVVLEGEQVPVIDLRNLFEISGKRPLISSIIVIDFDLKKVGLIADHIIGEHQAVLKSLGKMFRKVQAVSGGTILGDGQIALILDVHRIISDHIENTKHAEVKHG